MFMKRKCFFPGGKRLGEHCLTLLSPMLRTVALPVVTSPSNFAFLLASFSASTILAATDDTFPPNRSARLRSFSRSASWKCNQIKPKIILACVPMHSKILMKIAYQTCLMLKMRDFSLSLSSCQMINKNYICIGKLVSVTLEHMITPFCRIISLRFFGICNYSR